MPGRKESDEREPLSCCRCCHHGILGRAWAVLFSSFRLVFLNPFPRCLSLSFPGIHPREVLPRPLVFLSFKSSRGSVLAQTVEPSSKPLEPWACLRAGSVWLVCFPCWVCALNAPPPMLPKGSFWIKFSVSDNVLTKLTFPKCL